MYKVYWIKYPEHNDPQSEGYIGITSQTIEKRFDNHKHNTKNHYLRNRCRQEKVDIVCLHEGLNQQEARKIEEQYRPIENIGWNINKGGDLPPSRKGKSSPKSLLTGENRTEKQKAGTIRRSKKIKGNNFSGMRKNRVDYSKPCLNCGIIFNPGYQLRQKYCCLTCSALYREKIKKNGHHNG